MNAKELFDAGRLTEALAAATEAVKQNPGDVGRRAFLSGLLCFTSNLERADSQLDTIGTQDPKAAVGVSLLRQLVRAETARRDFFQQGRLPELLDQPPPHVRLALEASVCLREGKAQEAADLLVRADESRPHIVGTCDDQPFDGLRDLDDLTAGVLELLTSNGKYYWIPLERVESIEFSPPQRLQDLLWRSAKVAVQSGPDGVVHVPALYVDSYADADDALRLGRATDWRGGGAAPVRGVGQRTFLVGDQDRPIMGLREIRINS
jgi:type VI secretion system protein ImpE